MPNVWNPKPQLTQVRCAGRLGAADGTGTARAATLRGGGGAGVTTGMGGAAVMAERLTDRKCEATAGAVISNDAAADADDDE